MPSNHQHLWFSYQFLIKINKEIDPESTGSSLMHFPYYFLIKNNKAIASLRRGLTPRPGPFSKYNREIGPGNCSRELRTLPPTFSLLFSLTNKKEIAPESSGFSLLHFPFSFLSNTIRKLLPPPQDPPWAIFLSVSY